MTQNYSKPNKKQCETTIHHCHRWRKGSTAATVLVSKQGTSQTKFLAPSKEMTLSGKLCDRNVVRTFPKYCLTLLQNHDFHTRKSVSFHSIFGSFTARCFRRCAKACCAAYTLDDFDVQYLQLTAGQRQRTRIWKFHTQIPAEHNLCWQSLMARSYFQAVSEVFNNGGSV